MKSWNEATINTLKLMRIYLNIDEKRLSQEIEKGYKWFNMKNLKKTRLVVLSIYVDLYEAVVQT